MEFNKEDNHKHSWWVGLDEVSFYKFIKTYNFSYKGRRGLSPWIDMTEDFSTHLKYGASRSKIMKFIPTNFDLHFTETRSDKKKNEELEVIPYYEWNK